MSKKWGVIINTKVAIIIEIYESDMIEIKPIFGNIFSTIIDEIKKR